MRVSNACRNTETCAFAQASDSSAYILNVFEGPIGSVGTAVRTVLLARNPAMRDLGRYCSNAARSQPAKSAAASYVLCRKSRSMASGSSAVRTSS
jgi:hypothetical protein